MVLGVLTTLVCLLTSEAAEPASRPADSQRAPDLSGLLHADRESMARSWEAFEPDLGEAAQPVPAAAGVPLVRPAVQDSRSVPRDRPQGSPSGPGTPWLRTIGSLACVVGLIVLLAWGYRVVAERGVGLPLARQRQAGLVEVLSRTSLSPRHSVTLLRVGARLVLVGQSRDGLARIDAFEDADFAARAAGQAATAGAAGRSAEFRSSLAGAEKDLAEAEAELDEAALPAEGRLAELRDALTTATQRLRALRERI